MTLQPRGALSLFRQASVLPGAGSHWLVLLLLVAPLLAGCNHASSERQPISATGASSEGVSFREVASRIGLDHVWTARPHPLTALDSFGSGCAFLDYDNDGWQDVLLVDQPVPALFHNHNGKRFELVTDATGLSAVKGKWTGCAVADYDGDGWIDILLTGHHRLALLRNEGGRRWVDVTRIAGLDRENGQQWGSSAGFLDLDGDGDLDLVLLNYVVFGPDERQYCELAPGIRTGCPPSEYTAEYGAIWEQVDRGRFRRVPDERSGMASTHGRALVLAFVDLNRDGRMDFYIGNDGMPDDLMINLGGMKFENQAVEGGVAYGSMPGHTIAAMSADWADFNRDGRDDLFVTAFANEPYSLLRQLNDGSFEHAGHATSLSGPTLKSLGFGAKWIDFDNDGWPDLAVANGHVYDQSDKLDPLSPFRQPMMLFRNIDGQEFRDLLPTMEGDVRSPMVGRGLATGDYDNDGRQDILVVDHEGPVRLLRNTSATDHHWLTLELRAEGMNRYAYGAQITASAGEQTWISQVSPASSYLSSSDLRVHLGLGTVSQLDHLVIKWPSGGKTELWDVQVNRILRIKQGEGIIASSPSSRATAVP